MVSASTYYFTSNPNADNEGKADVSMGIKFAWVYHAGSLAFGSFIIALVEFVRIVFMYLAQKAE